MLVIIIPRAVEKCVWVSTILPQGVNVLVIYLNKVYTH